MNEEYRRTRRRRIVETVQVVDTMTETVIGHLGNLSETGMMLIASAPLVDDALYQLRFNLRDAHLPAAQPGRRATAHQAPRRAAGRRGHGDRRAPAVAGPRQRPGPDLDRLPLHRHAGGRHAAFASVAGFAWGELRVTLFPSPACGRRCPKGG